MNRKSLKPCPHCGGQAVHFERIADPGEVNMPEEVRCLACGSSSEDIEKWNARCSEPNRLTLPPSGAGKQSEEDTP